MNPPIMLLTVVAFGFTGLIAPELQKAHEKAIQRQRDSMKAYDEWNHTLCEQVEDKEITE